MFVHAHAVFDTLLLALSSESVNRTSACFAGNRKDTLRLSLDFYSNLIGQFSLSNVWLQIEHPLNEQFEERCRSEEFRRSYGGLIQACQEAVQKVRAASEEPDQKNPEETAPSRKDSEEAFSLPRF